MRNWSRRYQWSPSEVCFPKSEQAIQDVILKAKKNGQKVRIVGSAHSFNPLWVTDDILISLDQYQGLIKVDHEQMLATVKAGTKLRALGDLLFEQGLAMENLGDIDAQSIGGTIGTGTHGTGMDFGTISTQVKALRLINGLGEMVSCSESENADLFKAAQVSLGALGIITEITLKVVPAYRLELVNRQEALEDVLSSFSNRIQNNRNFEFYWFPYTQKSWSKTSNIVEDKPDKSGIANVLTEYVLENYIFQVMCDLANWVPSQNASVAKLSANSIPNLRKVFHSHRVYATKRLVRFNEMEYNIPLEAHEPVLKEIMKAFKKHRFPIHFPIENRVVKRDDIFLSPAYGRDSAYIACHAYYKKDFEPYFKTLEAIFLAHGGRPHWGKIHFLNSKQLAELYPKWADFTTYRQENDPSGLFLNSYLQEIL